MPLHALLTFPPSLPSLPSLPARLPALPSLQRPNQEVCYFAGVHPDDVAAAGPGALLVLALPAWHGWLYTSQARCCLGELRVVCVWAVGIA